jgi:hypothetical protein
LLFAPLIGIGISAGCGGSSDALARLTGAVTLDGQPLPANSHASVSFHPVNTGAARPTSAQIVSSRYDCPKVPKGQVLAYVHMSIPTGRTYRSDRTGKQEDELENVVLAPEEDDGIELNVTGDETVNFDLHRATRRRGAAR